MRITPSSSRIATWARGISCSVEPPSGKFTPCSGSRSGQAVRGTTCRRGNRTARRTPAIVLPEHLARSAMLLTHPSQLAESGLALEEARRNGPEDEAPDVGGVRHSATRLVRHCAEIQELQEKPHA